MFSLIITIISIALVAALAVATIYYGGSAFTQGSAQANASTLINGAQQTSGAATIFKNQNGGTGPTVIADLATGEFLQGEPAVPSGWAKLELGKADGKLVVYSVGTTADSEVCKKVQKQAINDETSAAKAIVATQPYGCFKSAAGDVTTTANAAVTTADKDVFFFKL